MDEVLNRLHHLLTDELERQQNVLGLCRAQAEAARKGDLAALEAKTAALDVLVEEARAAEPARQQTIGQAADACEAPPDAQTLERLAAAAPEPWRTRLTDLRARLRRVIAEVRDAVEANRRWFRLSLKVVDQTLRTFAQAAHDGPYTAQGVAPANAAPARLDQRG